MGYKAARGALALQERETVSERAFRRERILGLFRIHQPVRWIFYSMAVGALTGLFACAFFYLLEGMRTLNFNVLAGMPLRSASSDSLVHLPTSPVARHWVFFLLPAVGGLVSGLLVYRFAPEAEGHGTDALIDAFHNKKGEIRTPVPFVKAVATIFTLGSGGSAGREGPVAQIGGGLGSWMSRRLGFSVRDTRKLLLAGTAGGLGAIFRSPLGGAIIAIEVLYREDFESEALIPCIISSVTGYAIFSMIFGHAKILEVPAYYWRNPLELPFFAFLGLLCVPVGIFYVRVFYFARNRLFRSLKVPRYVKPMIGGLAVGCLGLALPEVYGAGWGYLQSALNGEMTIRLMLIVALVKIAATSFTVGSGGSGGVFGPTLFIGGMLGGAVGEICHHFFPHIVTTPEIFVLVGMCAFFAGVANAPIGALLMTTEMTGSYYGLVAPLLLVSVIALLFTRKWSIYENQVTDRFDSPAHIGDLTVNILEQMRVRRIYTPEAQPMGLQSSMSFAAFRKMISETDRNYFPVYDGPRLSGIVSLKTVRPILFEQDVDSILVVKDVSVPLVTITPEESLYSALIKFLRSGYTQLPVVDPQAPDAVLGYLRHEDLMMAYNKEILHRKAEVMRPEGGAAAGGPPRAPRGGGRPPGP